MTSIVLWWPFTRPPRIYLCKLPKPPRQALSTLPKGPFCSPEEGWLRPGAVCNQCPWWAFSADAGGVGVSPRPLGWDSWEVGSMPCRGLSAVWSLSVRADCLLGNAPSRALSSFLSLFSFPLAEFSGLCSKYFTCTQIFMSGSASGGTKST